MGHSRKLYEKKALKESENKGKKWRVRRKFLKENVVTAGVDIKGREETK
jgi:hypothetical protein